MDEEWTSTYEDDFIRIDKSGYEEGGRKITLKENKKILLTERNRLSSSLELGVVPELVSVINTNITRQHGSLVNFFDKSSINSEYLVASYCLAYIKEQDRRHGLEMFQLANDSLVD